MNWIKKTLRIGEKIKDLSISTDLPKKRWKKVIGHHVVKVQY